MLQLKREQVPAMLLVTGRVAVQALAPVKAPVERQVTVKQVWERL